MEFNKKIDIATNLFQKHLSKFTDSNMTEESYAELFTEDAVQQFPYAPAPYATEVIGREAIVEYISNVTQGAKDWKFDNFIFTATEDPEVFFVEFEGGATVLSTGKDYHQLYIGQLTLKDNKIAAYREYWNPIWILDAFVSKK
jgi:Ketosteroid isomerase-related protein